jgi:penicillin-binding protein 1C
LLSKKKKFAAVAIMLPLLIYILIPIHQENLENYSTVVTDKDGKILRAFLNSDEQWHFRFDNDIKIPEKLETAVLTYEDRYFYYHPGINPYAIFRAIWLNIKFGKVKSGGSTITMQLARISKPKARTLINKLFEVIQATKLEIKYSKKSILRKYLENAPYGGNIVGFRAASLKYYGKEPNSLTWSEAATLAVLPNAPGLIAPGKNQEILLKKRNRLLKILHERDFIDKNLLELSLLETLPDRSINFPQLANHLAEEINSTNNGLLVETTLDFNIQKRVEEVAKRYSQMQQFYGIDNLSILISNTETGEIVAYVGSQDYWDNEHNGKVNGVIAPRSTGSTLKPFLFALSIDDGLILPQTMMKDIPTYFSAFTPENASEKYLGLVTAHEALVKSLNIPAVRLLNTYGYNEFYRFLELGGISTLFREPEEYGLTLIIGGSEATLFDLVQLYQGLGNFGEFSKISWVKNENDLKKKTLISPGASFLTLEMMSDLKRPGIEKYWQNFPNSKRIAWKTGTSYGQRDAWAIGVNPQWTVGVWVGNFPGEGNNSLSGAASAGPLLFDLFSLLPDSGAEWFEQPFSDMQLVKLCKTSGFTAGKNCTEVDTVWAPRNNKNLPLCTFHRKIYVNEDESKQVCSNCWEAGKYHDKIITDYPPKVKKYLRMRGLANFDIPPHNEECSAVNSENELVITYPKSNVSIFIPKDFGGIKQGITLEAVHSQKKIEIFWYLDDEYIGKTFENHTMLCNVGQGLHTLFLVDQNGVSDEITFEVLSK